MPQFASADLGGIYRLVFTDLYGSYNSSRQTFASQLGFGLRVSNPFALDPQPR